MSAEKNIDKQKALDSAIAKLKKQFGDGAIMRMGEKPEMEVEAISTGSLNLDLALGVGGLPRGRIIEIYGPESCLAADTFIQYEVRELDSGKRINHKGGSIEHLYKRFHNICNDGRSNKLNRDEICFYINSINENNAIIQQPIADVKKCGKKECFQLTTASGHTIDATEDHQFYVGNGEYKKLKDLLIGDEVFIHNNTPLRKEHKQRAAYKECYVKYHPSEKYKTITVKNNNGSTSSFVYCRVYEHVLVVEALLNGLSLEEYVKVLNTKSKDEINNLITLNMEKIDVHHIDTNERNNDITNLQILPKSLHYRTHAKSNIDNFSYIVTPTKITAIEPIGERETYDIKCFVPYNNYIANGIAVHNCGKSTLAMHCVAEVQKTGGTACYIDAEHAMDPAYAESLGVDTQNLLIAQPSCGEEALEICDAMVRSGGIDIIIVDSVAALVPKAELEGEMGDAVVGLQARLMSQAMRKLTGSINQSRCVVIFINQIRQKIGVMYGCLHGETRVNFVDGRSIPIKEVVEQQIDGEVWSYNEETKQFEAKKIIDWHYNGAVKHDTDYIHIETNSVRYKDSHAGGGRFGFTVTPDHKVMTESGWKMAKDITMDDKIMTKYKSVVNSSVEDFLWGTIIGDATIEMGHKSSARIRFQDSNNPEYAQWKADMLGVAFNFHRKELKHLGASRVRFISSYNRELVHIKNELGQRDPLAFLNNHYSNLGMALWYMDDGCYSKDDYHNRVIISVKRFKNNSKKLNDIKEALEKRGFNVSVNLNDGYLRFTSESTNKLFDTIAKFVPACMQYKLPTNYQGKYEEFKLTFNEEIKTDYVKVVMIRNASKKQMLMCGKYDISVEDNHNYMVGGFENGIIVHNSPETTTGGNALKFYSSVRLDIRRVEQIKQGSEVIGNHVRVKVVKNKVAPPFREAEFDIVFGKGISKDGEIIDAAVALEVIQKGGAWFSYTNEATGRAERWQGRERVKEALAADETLKQEIEDAVLQALKKH